MKSVGARFKHVLCSHDLCSFLCHFGFYLVFLYKNVRKYSLFVRGLGNPTGLEDLERSKRGLNLSVLYMHVLYSISPTNFGLPPGHLLHRNVRITVCLSVV